jgi:hypothetical protein
MPGCARALSRRCGLGAVARVAGAAPGRGLSEGASLCGRRWVAARSVGGRGVAEVGLDRAAELHRQRRAVAVQCLADGDAHPALADAVFLDVGLFDALEADADAALEQGAVVVGALGVVREAVGRGVGHAGGLGAGRGREAQRDTVRRT